MQLKASSSLLKKRLLSGGAWAFSGKSMAAFSGVLVNVFLTRLLTPDELGAYFLTLSLVTMAAIFAQLGLTQTIIRLVAESMTEDNPERARQVILYSLGLATISMFVVAFLFAFGGGQWIAKNMFHSDLMVSVMQMAALWVIILVSQGIIAEIFRGFHDIKIATLFGGLSTSLLMMLMFAGLWLFQGFSEIDQVIVLSLVAGTSSVVISGFFLGKKLTTLPSSTSSISLKDILSIAWPLWITSLVFLVVTQTDILVLGLFRSQSEVAIYGATVRLIALVAVPLIIVNAVVPPIIADMYSQGKMEELEKTLRFTATVAAVPSLVVFIVFVFGREHILGIVFGEFYRGAGLILVILCIGQIVNVWVGSCGLVLMLTGHQTRVMVIMIMCGLVTIASALFLVRQYGGIGVASAVAFGTILQNIWMLLSVKKNLGLWAHVDLHIIRDIRRVAWKGIGES